MDPNFAIRERNLSSPGTKSFDVPDFDEAFHEESLKKFYQDADSYSQTSSPMKEPEFSEEFNTPNDLGPDALLSSPLGRFIKRMGEEPPVNHPLLDVELETGLQADYHSGSYVEADVSHQKVQQRLVFDNTQYNRTFERHNFHEMGDNTMKMMMNGSLQI
jgi:hypothetical protein